MSNKKQTNAKSLDLAINKLIRLIEKVEEVVSDQAPGVIKEIQLETKIQLKMRAVWLGTMILLLAVSFIIFVPLSMEGNKYASIVLAFTGLGSLVVLPVSMCSIQDYLMYKNCSKLIMIRKLKTIITSEEE